MQAHSTHVARFPATSRFFAPIPGSEAERVLFDAIMHASERDMLARIDQAISMGAQLNHPDAYELNAIVIAARSNRPEALWPLTLRGGQPPTVPSDGVDLLMEACRRGNEAMARGLVEVVGIAVDYSDAQGWSALHHAVLSGSASLVRYLLSSGADPNDAALALDAAQNSRIFGNAYPLTAKEVTPLMMALGLGHDAIASALLDAGADPNAGGCSPLVLAACHDRRGLFAELLDRGALLHRCRNWQKNKALDACIYARMPVCYLGLLVHMHDFTQDDGSIMSPLGSAVSLQDVDTVALLLACGAPVEPHQGDSDYLSLWDQALPPRQGSSDVLDLLTARSVAVVQVGDLPLTERLLDLIADQIDQPDLLASLGIFTSLLTAAAGPIRHLARQPILDARQRALQVAMTLMQALPNLPPPAPAHPSKPLLPHESWKRRTAQERHHQCVTLRQAAAHLVSECMEQLKATVGHAFFVACIDGRPDGLPPEAYIASQIARLSGAPDPVISLVRDAWTRAVTFHFDWNVALDDRDKSRRFMSAMTRNLLRKALEDDEIEHTPLVDLCLNALHAALPPDLHMLDRFCRDPLAWLAQFEARHGRDDAGNPAGRELQLELALPRSICDAIWALWHQSTQQSWQQHRAEVRQAGNQTLVTRKRQFALHLPDIVLTHYTEDLVPPSAAVKLLNWQANMLTPAGPAQAQRGQPAGSKAPGGPQREEPDN